jgi:hypothetical protein
MAYANFSFLIVRFISDDVHRRYFAVDQVSRTLLPLENLKRLQN